MAGIEVTKTAKVQLQGVEIGVSDLKDIIAQVPDSAVLRIERYGGDPRDQRDRPYATLVFTWKGPGQ